MERLYLQGRLDEAAKIALKMLAYAHPRIRSVKAKERHPAHAPDVKSSTFDVRRLSAAEVEWLLTILRSLPKLEPEPEPEPERSAGPGVLRPLDVVQQAIRQHRLAGRLQQAAALAVRVAPYEHPRIQSISDDERAAEARRHERERTRENGKRPFLGISLPSRLRRWRGSWRRRMASKGKHPECEQLRCATNRAHLVRSSRERSAGGRWRSGLIGFSREPI